MFLPGDNSGFFWVLGDNPFIPLTTGRTTSIPEHPLDELDSEPFWASFGQVWASSAPVLEGSTEYPVESNKSVSPKNIDAICFCESALIMHARVFTFNDPVFMIIKKFTDNLLFLSRISLYPSGKEMYRIQVQEWNPMFFS